MATMLGGKIFILPPSMVAISLLKRVTGNGFKRKYLSADRYFGAVEASDWCIIRKFHNFTRDTVVNVIHIYSRL